MSRDQGAATGKTPYETTRCTCKHLSTLHTLPASGGRGPCSSWDCTCRRFSEATGLNPRVGRCVMVEVTDEMVYAFAGEPEITATDAHAISVGLAAVLAIVERDNQVHPLCTATLGTGMRCEHESGMAHPDEHSARAPGGSRIRWS